MRNRRLPKQNAVQILLRLIHLVRPLAGFMLLAITMGTLGFLCAGFIPVFGGFALLHHHNYKIPFSIGTVHVLLITFALVRAFLRYAEQRTNHYIAFTLLAIIRDRVFRALRRLCPAKLEGRGKGDLIALITSDVELLEVFYAHTISPICIAVLVETIMCIFIGSWHPALGLLALCAYLCVGVVLPVVIFKRSGTLGDDLRAQNAGLSAYMLENIRGLDETRQFGCGQARMNTMHERTLAYSEKQGELNKLTGTNQAVANTMVLLFDAAMLVLCSILYQKGMIGFDGFLIPQLALISSFGPVMALANLGTALQATIASGARILAILDEEPATEDISGKEEVSFHGAAAENVNFSYDATSRDTVANDGPGARTDTRAKAQSAAAAREGARAKGHTDTRTEALSAAREGARAKAHTDTRAEAQSAAREGARAKGQVTNGVNDGMVLKDLSLSLPENRIIGIVGKSGCGKSTLLKLFMRFWKTDSGKISISGRSVEEINTSNLRDMESYMTQETHLFKDTIAGNLRVAKLDATQEELETACKKAAIHDFIMTLPRGYETPVGELGDTLSGGERQRIGLARVFLHNAPFILLDEPTSNLDSLNEAIILKSLKEESAGRTVALVSHRESTVRIADEVFHM